MLERAGDAGFSLDRHRMAAAFDLALSSTLIASGERCAKTSCGAADGADFLLQALDAFAPRVAQRGFPRRRVARGLLHRLAHADRERPRIDAMAAFDYVLVLALEPRPPQLRVAHVVPGAQPVAAVPDRFDRGRVARRNGLVFQERRRVEDDARRAAVQARARRPQRRCAHRCAASSIFSFSRDCSRRGRGLLDPGDSRGADRTRHGPADRRRSRCRLRAPGRHRGRTSRVRGAG